MTTVTARAGSVAVTATPARAVIVLGWREGRRMLTSPVFLVLVGAVLLTGARSISSGAELLRVLGAVLVSGALATLFAVSLVATSSRRTGAESQFAATPLDPQLRTLATGLGVLLGPVAVASLLSLAMFAVDQVFDPKLAYEYGQDATLSSWEYVQFPLTWLGAGLLAVALARWLPWPGVPLAVFVGLIAWTMWSANLIDDGRAGGFLMPFVITSKDVLELGVGSTAGQIGWHIVYLLGLCLLALAAALLWHRPLRQPAVIGFGVLAAFLTASAAWLQLP